MGPFETLCTKAGFYQHRAWGQASKGPMTPGDLPLLWLPDRRRH